MKYEQAKMLAKELCARYGLDTYIHTDPACGFNIRFEEPIETVRPVEMASTCYTVGIYVLVNGYPQFEPRGLTINGRSEFEPREL